MKNQITIRGFGDDLEARLKATARKHQTSLNRAAIMLLRKGAGLRQEFEGPETVGNSLDTFIGSWSRDDERQLLESIDHLDRVDEAMWQ